MKRTFVPFIFAGLTVGLTIMFLNWMAEEPTAPKSFWSEVGAYLLALTLGLGIFLTLYFRKITIQQIVSNSYIALFFVIILTPEFVKQFGLEKKVVINEKRPLAKKPEFAFSKDYPSQYEAYYNDNFGLRSNIISFTNKMKTSFLRASTKPDVVQFGKGGFLFLVSGYAVLPSYTNTNLFTSEELEATYQRIFTRKKRLNEQGIKFVQGFWPNKHTAYKAELPATMKRKIKSETSLADQICTYFKERNLSFLDVRKDLLVAKKEAQLYQKFDTHWNLNGSFAAYQSFCKQTHATLGLTAFEKKDFDIRYKQTRKGDLVYMLGMNEFPEYYDELPQYSLKNKALNYKEIKDKSFPDRTVITINEGCKNKEVALVFRDSYGKDFIPFLSLHYYKVVYIYCSDIPYYKEELIAKVQPNIVMSFGVERYLTLVLE